MKFLSKKEISDICDFADAKVRDDFFWKELEKAYLEVYSEDPLILDHQRFTYFAQVNLCFQYFTKQE